MKRKNAARAKQAHAEDFGRQAALCRALRCLACGREGCVPAHHPSRRAGGEDGDCVPLCDACHARQHAGGVVSFQQRHAIDMQIGAAILRAVLATGDDTVLQLHVARHALGAIRGLGVDPRTGGHAPVRAPRPKVGR